MTPTFQDLNSLTIMGITCRNPSNKIDYAGEWRRFDGNQELVRPLSTDGYFYAAYLQATNWCVLCRRALCHFPVHPADHQPDLVGYPWWLATTRGSAIQFDHMHPDLGSFPPRTQATMRPCAS